MVLLLCSLCFSVGFCSFPRFDLIWLLLVLLTSLDFTSVRIILEIVHLGLVMARFSAELEPLVRTGHNSNRCCCTAAAVYDSFCCCIYADGRRRFTYIQVHIAHPVQQQCIIVVYINEKYAFCQTDRTSVPPFLLLITCVYIYVLFAMMILVPMHLILSTYALAIMCTSTHCCCCCEEIMERTSQDLFEICTSSE